MPQRKKMYNYRRRNPRNRRNNRKTRVHRTLQPSTYNFTRSYVENLQLNTSLPPLGWAAVGNGLVRSQSFTLQLLPNFSEFQNLFVQYRLLAVSQEYYFSDTASTNVGTTPNSTQGSKQILMYINPNAVGRDNQLLLTEQFFLESQVAKKEYVYTVQENPLDFIPN